MNVEPNQIKSNWKPSFFAIWSGQAFSLLGSMLVQFALIWWLTKMTGSATVLATASLAGLIPQVFLAPFAGTWVDRRSRRSAMIIADTTIALATVVLALLFWAGVVQIWHVYLLMFVRSTAGAFHWPAMQASTSLMVPKEHLSRVQGLNQMLNGLMNIGAAPLGALLLGLLPMQGILAIDVVTALLAVVPLLFIAVPQPSNGKAALEETPTFWEDFKAGFKYVATWPGVVALLIVATIINLLLNSGFSLLPILVTKHFSGEALQLAGIESAWGIGVVAGGLLLSAWGGFKRRILTSLMGLILMGMATFTIGILPPSAFLIAVAAMLVTGFANPITNGPLFAVLQGIVAPEMQGRVFTLIGSVAAAMTPIGLMIAGPVADIYGIQTWFILGGVVTLLMGVISYFIPAIMNIEEGRKEPPGKEDRSEAGVELEIT